MASAFVPDHTFDFQAEGLIREQFIVMAVETARSLSWNITYLTQNGFIAQTYNDEIRVMIKENNLISVQSRYHTRRMATRGTRRTSIEVFMHTLQAMQYEFVPGEMAWKYEELKESFQPEDDHNSLTKGPTGDAFFLFKPGKGYFVTPILIYLNILVFALMALSGVGILQPEVADLLKWGANFRPLTLDGEWWRLLTCCFIHIGIIHLAMNMYALMFIGLLLEPHLGKVKFTVAYLLTGIIASVASLYWHEHTVSAGASGAIFGMYGLFLAMLTTNLIEKSIRKALFASIIVFILYNLANGLQSGIDNAAHIGGLLSGMAIGYAFYPALMKPERKTLQYASIALVTLATIIGTFFTLQQFPRDLVKYEAQMNTFSLLDKKAFEATQQSTSIPKGELLLLLKNTSIPNVHQMLAILHGVKQMDLSEKLQQRNELLQNYSELRLKSYELYYKRIETDNALYDDSLKVYESRINTVLLQLDARE